MKRSVPLLFAALLLVIAVACTHDHPLTADPSQKTAPADSLFTDIDTTLHITTLIEGPLTIYSIDRYNTTVVKIPRITSYMFFEHQDRSLQQVGLDSNFALVMNTSFIDEFVTYTPTDTIVTFRHAGYLKINHRVIDKLKIERQLTKILAYDSRRERAEYFEVNELERTLPYDLVVQTGPMIVSKSRLDTAAIYYSVNGLRPASRTMFASVNGREFYAIVTRGYVMLPEIGTMLMRSGIFKKDLDIIDFDGGPSTSLYIKNHPELSFYADRKMPALMGVR